MRRYGTAISGAVFTIRIISCAAVFAFSPVVFNLKIVPAFGAKDGEPALMKAVAVSVSFIRSRRDGVAMRSASIAAERVNWTTPSRALRARAMATITFDMSSSALFCPTAA